MASSSELSNLPPGLKSLGSSFVLWGRISFWLKLALAVVSSITALFAFFAVSFGGQPTPTNQPLPPGGIPTPPPTSASAISGVGLFLTVCGILLLGVSAYWSFRYIQWGRRLRSSTPGVQPSRAATLAQVKWSLRTDLLGMLLAVIAGQSIVGSVLTKSLLQIGNFYNMLNNAVGPVDILVILVCIHVITGQFVGMGVSLYLLQRTVQPQKASS